MKITQAEFVKSAMAPRDYPRDGRPEVAFVGRSNVGKSSLLNALLGRKGLAKTSSTPGKTRTLNFFSVNNKYYFVDLPGYGFAKVPRALKDEWGSALLAYLNERAALRLIVVLLDARHAPSDRDREMLDMLEGAERPVLIVATKVDKLNQSERVHLKRDLRAALEFGDEVEIVSFSAVTDAGVVELRKILGDVLAGHA